MAEASCTPGPWEVVQLNTFGPFAIRMNYSGEKTFYGVGQIARENDAKAIASLPDLLRALTELRDWYEDFTGLPACAANSALAKAWGKA